MERWLFKFPTHPDADVRDRVWSVRDPYTLESGVALNEMCLRVEWKLTTPLTLYRNNLYEGVRIMEDKEVGDRVARALPSVAGAKKFDGDKPMMDLLFDGCPAALLQVGAVLTYGFKKYGGKHGWKALPDAIKRYEAAMLRHQLAAASGEVNDPESGLPHAAHIACNALFLAELKKGSNATEER